MNNSEMRRTERVSPPTHFFTYDEERIEHIITDEQLMQLATGGQDISLQVSIGALGVAMGYFQNLVSVVGSVQDSSPIGTWQALGAGIFIVATTTFIVATLYYRRTSSDVRSLIEKIKNRKVGVMGEPPYVSGKPFPGDPSISTGTSSTTE